MIDFDSLLSSISDDDMAKIKNIAESIMGNDKENQEKPRENALSSSDFSVNSDMLKKIMTAMGQMNKEDYRTRLITDLKPMLSDERKRKADEAVRFLQLMEILPLLKGIF